MVVTSRVEILQNEGRKSGGSEDLPLQLRPLRVPLRHFLRLARQFLAMPDLLFAALGRSRIFLVGTLQPTVNAHNFFFHGPRIRSKTQQRPSNLYRSRRKIRGHVLLRFVEKPPPVRAGRFGNRNLNQIIIVPDFLNRLRRASPLNSSGGQSILQVAPASLPASDDEKSHQMQHSRADYETEKAPAI